MELGAAPVVDRIPNTRKIDHMMSHPCFFFRNTSLIGHKATANNSPLTGWIKTPSKVREPIGSIRRMKFPRHMDESASFSLPLRFRAVDR